MAVAVAVPPPGVERASREALHEVIDQRGYVFAVLAEGRHHEVNDVDAIKQIFAEQTLRDQLPQIPVRGGDDPHVRSDRHALRAHFLNLAGFQKAQQQALHPQGHFPDLIEEDGAVARHLQLPRAVAKGAGEAPLDVAEQLGLEQRLGNASAIDRDERGVRAKARGAYRPGNDLLANTALARDEHLGVGASDPVDLDLQFVDRGAGPNQINRPVRSHSLRPVPVLATG